MQMDTRADRDDKGTSHFSQFANTPKNNAIKTRLILQWVHITCKEMQNLCTINSNTM